MAPSGRIIHNLLHNSRRSLFSSSFSATRFALTAFPAQAPSLQIPSSYSTSHLVGFSWTPNSTFASHVTLRFLNTCSSEDFDDTKEHPHQYETEGDREDIEWEEEDEVEPEIGDGGDGGGVVLQNVPWGERALCIAHEVLLQFGDDMKLFAFKTTPRGYIYVRLDKLSNKYGCPSIEEIESYSEQYKKRLDEIGALGEIPDNLALEVSSPGAERLLRVPDDLYRFIDMPMRVCYVEEVEAKCPEKDGVFLLECVETESENCVWKLADVKENRDPLAKGRPLSRKQKDWRLKLPYAMFKRMSLPRRRKPEDEITKLPGFTVLSASSVHVLPSYQLQQGAVFFLYSTKSGHFDGWLTAPIAATEERSPRAIVVVVGIVHSPLGIFPHEPTYEMEVETLYDENLKWTMRDKDRLLL